MRVVPHVVFQPVSSAVLVDVWRWPAGSRIADGSTLVVGLLTFYRKMWYVFSVIDNVSEKWYSTRNDVKLMGGRVGLVRYFVHWWRVHFF